MKKDVISKYIEIIIKGDSLPILHKFPKTVFYGLEIEFPNKEGKQVLQLLRWQVGFFPTSALRSIQKVFDKAIVYKQGELQFANPALSEKELIKLIPRDKRTKNIVSTINELLKL